MSALVRGMFGVAMIFALAATPMIGAAPAERAAGKAPGGAVKKPVDKKAADKNARAVRINTAEAARRIFKNADADRNGKLSDAEASRAVKTIEKLVEEASQRALQHKNVTIKEVFGGRQMPTMAAGENGGPALADFERFVNDLADGADDAVRTAMRQRAMEQAGVVDPRLSRAEQAQAAAQRDNVERQKMLERQRQRQAQGQNAGRPGADAGKKKPGGK